MASNFVKGLISTFPQRRYADGGSVEDSAMQGDVGNFREDPTPIPDDPRWQALYQKYGKPVVDAVTAPGRAYNGQLQVTDPSTGLPTDEAIGEAGNMAGMMGLGSAPSLARAGVDPSHIGMFTGAAGKELPARELDSAGFYSRALENSKVLEQPKGTVSQFTSLLKKSGVKDRELEATGWNKLDPNQKMTRQDVEDYFRQNRVQLGEVVRGRPPEPDSDKYNALTEDLYRRADEAHNNGLSDEARRLYDQVHQLDAQHRAEWDAYYNSGMPPAKYSGWVTPGEKQDYKERLLTLPSFDEPGNKVLHEDVKARAFELMRQNGENENEITRLQRDWAGELYDRPEWEQAKRDLGVEGKERVGEFGSDGHYYKEPPKDYFGHHWGDTGNVAVHTRDTTRDLPGLGKTHLIEEIQSDWGQEGRDQGFKQEGMHPYLEQYKIPHDAMVAQADKWYDHYRSLLDEAKNVSATEDWDKWKRLQSAAGKAFERYAEYSHHAAMEDLPRGPAGQAMTDWNYKEFYDVPNGPIANNAQDYTDVAIKKSLMEAAKKDADYVALPEGKEHVRRYFYGPMDNGSVGREKMLKANNGYRGYYEDRAKNRLLAIGRELDKEANPQIQDHIYDTGETQRQPIEPLENYYSKHEKPEAPPFLMTEQGVSPKLMTMKLTPQMKEEAKKGLPIFMRGLPLPPLGQLTSTTDLPADAPQLARGGRVDADDTHSRIMHASREGYGDIDDPDNTPEVPWQDNPYTINGKPYRPPGYAKGGSVPAQPGGSSGNEAWSNLHVDAPAFWQSAPDHPPTHLAYITDEEHALLKHLDMHRSGVSKEDHWGPRGIPSLDGAGDDSGNNNYSGGTTSVGLGDAGYGGGYNGTTYTSGSGNPADASGGYGYGNNYGNYSSSYNGGAAQYGGYQNSGGQYGVSGGGISGTSYGGYGGGTNSSGYSPGNASINPYSNSRAYGAALDRASVPGYSAQGTPTYTGTNVGLLHPSTGTLQSAGFPTTGVKTVNVNGYQLSQSTADQIAKARANGWNDSQITNAYTKGWWGGLGALTSSKPPTAPTQTPQTPGTPAAGATEGAGTPTEGAKLPTFAGLANAFAYNQAPMAKVGENSPAMEIGSKYTGFTRPTLSSLVTSRETHAVPTFGRSGELGGVIGGLGMNEYGDHGQLAGPGDNWGFGNKFDPYANDVGNNRYISDIQSVDEENMRRQIGFDSSHWAFNAKNFPGEGENQIAAINNIFGNLKPAEQPTTPPNPQEGSPFRVADLQHVSPNVEDQRNPVVQQLEQLAEKYDAPLPTQTDVRPLSSPNVTLGVGPAMWQGAGTMPTYGDTAPAPTETAPEQTGFQQPRHPYTPTPIWGGPQYAEAQGLVSQGDVANYMLDKGATPEQAAVASTRWIRGEAPPTYMGYDGKEHYYMNPIGGQYYGDPRAAGDPVDANGNLISRKNNNLGATPDRYTSFGLGQMHSPERQEGMLDATGGDLSNWRGQVDYMMSEPQYQRWAAQTYGSPEKSYEGFRSIYEGAVSNPAVDGPGATNSAAYVGTLDNGRFPATARATESDVPPSVTGYPSQPVPSMYRDYERPPSISMELSSVPSRMFQQGMQPPQASIRDVGIPYGGATPEAPYQTVNLETPPNVPTFIANGLVGAGGAGGYNPPTRGTVYRGPDGNLYSGLTGAPVGQAAASVPAPRSAPASAPPRAPSVAPVPPARPGVPTPPPRPPADIPNTAPAPYPHSAPVGLFNIGPGTSELEGATYGPGSPLEGDVTQTQHLVDPHTVFGTALNIGLSMFGGPLGLLATLGSYGLTGKSPGYATIDALEKLTGQTLTEGDITALGLDRGSDSTRAFSVLASMGNSGTFGGHLAGKPAPGTASQPPASGGGTGTGSGSGNGSGNGNGNSGGGSEGSLPDYSAREYIPLTDYTDYAQKQGGGHYFYRDVA